MYVRHERVADSDATERLLLREEDVEFDDEGRARVPAGVGEQLAEHYDAVEVAEREDGGDSGTTEDTDS